MVNKKLEKIVRMVTAGDKDAEWLIDELTHSERIAVREALGDGPQPRNLHFDYAAQVWIEAGGAA